MQTSSTFYVNLVKPDLYVGKFTLFPVLQMRKEEGSEKFSDSARIRASEQSFQECSPFSKSERSVRTFGCSVMPASLFAGSQGRQCFTTCPQIRSAALSTQSLHGLAPCPPSAFPTTGHVARGGFASHPTLYLQRGFPLQIFMAK